MNAQIDDGGPAFPESASGPYPNGEIVLGRPGMTLRDWFAGMALQGRATRLGNPHEHRDLLASDCYDIADAMIEARKGDRL
jgi:hypothetical protein